MPERDLIAAIVARLGAPAPPVLLGPGDDAAVVTASGVQVVSVDATVDGVHTRLDRDGWTWHDAGHRALATALSDLAAMGAAPGEAYVALGLPDTARRGDALRLCDGMAELAAAHGATIAGGDVTHAPVLVVTATVVGHAPGPDRLLRRDAVRPGDRIGVTGALGGAAAGLALLEDRARPAGLAAPVADALRARHLRPAPLLAEGVGLVEGGVRAGIDLSDGLATDAAHLARASGCTLRIELERLPLQAGVVEVAAALRVPVADLAAGGGEDFELLVAVPEGVAPPVPLTWIGTAEEGPAEARFALHGAPRTLRGHEHAVG